MIRNTLNPNCTRRSFLKGTAATIAAPLILRSGMLGAESPSNRISVGIIGTGRQSHVINVPQFLRSNRATVTAVCDVDRWRMEQERDQVNNFYAEANGNSSYDGCMMYDDFRELLAQDDIDAVMISSPDHWHVPMGIAALRAGKHASIEKPLSTCIAHGRMLCDVAKETGLVTRTDSEFRSLPNFWKAVEIVRNGRIGQLQEVRVSAPGDSEPVGNPEPMDIPDGLNYDLWLGPAPEAPYTELRVHPPNQMRVRPGWLRISDYTNGMISNWGSHLNDIVQWANNSDRSGPVSVSGTGSFSEGLWDTITAFDLEYSYANGVKLHYTMGGAPTVAFRGSEGWIRVGYPDAIEASNPDWLEESPGDDELDLSGTMEDKEDFLHAIQTGGETIKPVEVGHRTVSLCQIGLIAVQVARPLRWNPDIEQFEDDEEANALLQHPIRCDWL